MTTDLMLDREQVRAVDRYAMTHYGILGLVLMENAARGCIECLMSCGVGGGVCIWCGPGNNGGDGLAMARRLCVLGVPVRCVMCVAADKLQGDARANYDITKRLNDIELVSWTTNDADDLERFSHEPVNGHEIEWSVDALLGTGAKGALREPYLSLVGHLNELDHLRFAVDLPTGVDCDTGAVEPIAFVADHTATMVATKPGLTVAPGKEHAGKIHIVDIGIPAQIIREAIAGLTKG